MINWKMKKSPLKKDFDRGEIKKIIAKIIKKKYNALQVHEKFRTGIQLSTFLVRQAKKEMGHQQKLF